LQSTFDRGDGKYDNAVDSLSSHLRSQLINNYATINLQGKTQKLSYTFTNSWIDYRYSQRDLSTGTLQHLHYLNWSPWLTVNYYANSTTSFALNYSASVQQPSMTQLQPIKNNSDPLHITIGNPDLRPGYNQNFSLEYRRMRSWMMNIRVNLGSINNSISTKMITDSLGRQISQAVNVNGATNAGLSFSLNKKILGFDAGARFAGNYSRTVNYINTDLSNNDSYTTNGGFGISRNVPDKYSLQLYSTIGYFETISSINKTAPLHYWTQNHSGALTLFLIKNFEINTNATYSWQQKTSAFADNTSVLLWNAYVSRNFLQNKLALRVQLNNILDRIAGISRTNTANITTASSTNILGRYYILSAIYHFDKKMKKK
jgi:outer membrane receptor protein involved in Fe transport